MPENQKQTEAVKGRIMAVQRERYELLVNGKKHYGRLKTSIYYRESGGTKYEFPTVGDWVTIQENSEGDAYIIATDERRSCFIRKNPSDGVPDQAVAANFDYVLIVMSLNQDFNITKLERYLAAAWQSGGTPMVILSKADLCPEADREALTMTAETAAPGVDILTISARTGEGLEQLKTYLTEGKSAVLLGSSGVGKSSLVNALLGEELMETGAIREGDAQGRHTTTYRQSFIMSGGGLLIDTPGMRRLEVSEGEEGISTVYQDIEKLFLSCRFRNCTHSSEEGCAIQTALADGSLLPKKWSTYQQMKREENHSRIRAQVLKNKQAKTRKKYSKRDRKSVDLEQDY